MRRGRQAKLRAGTLLPWTTPPFGYRLDPERPRQAAGVRVEPGEAVLVAQLFDWYLEPQATVYRLARRLTDLGVATPMGKPRWNVASVRGILRNPAYTGRALTNRTQVVPARERKSALLPVGPGQSHAPRPEEDWIAVPVPRVVSEEIFAQVQAKLDTNQRTALRNTRHEYLLRALVSCGACRLRPGQVRARRAGRGGAPLPAPGRAGAGGAGGDLGDQRRTAGPQGTAVAGARRRPDRARAGRGGGGAGQHDHLRAGRRLTMSVPGP